MTHCQLIRPAYQSWYVVAARVIYSSEVDQTLLNHLVLCMAALTQLSWDTQNCPSFDLNHITCFLYLSSWFIFCHKVESTLFMLTKCWPLLNMDLMHSCAANITSSCPMPWPEHVRKGLHDIFLLWMDFSILTIQG